MSKVYVDLDEAKRLLLEADMGLVVEDLAAAERLLRDAETVTITRCGECRFCMNGQLHRWPLCSHPEHPGQRVRLEGFCDLGERRQNNVKRRS